jgi:ketosteroid isomerase-like protein
MPRSFVWLLVTALACGSPVAAQRFGPEPSAAIKREILRLREAAWRTFYANDQDGFKRVVPRELIAMGWSGGTWNDRAEILAAMAERAKSGETIETLEFPRNEFQAYGDVVILYTAFRLVTKAANGSLHETKGRGTEVFVRHAGSWAHTAWHLDTIAN